MAGSTQSRSSISSIQGLASSPSQRSCPPEDVGGPWGYVELLDAIDDPARERHADLHQWIPVQFNPSVADVKSLSEEVAVLAKRWSRRPSGKLARRR
jgi:hypothetical protein